MHEKVRICRIFFIFTRLKKQKQMKRMKFFRILATVSALSGCLAVSCNNGNGGNEETITPTIHVKGNADDTLKIGNLRTSVFKAKDYPKKNRESILTIRNYENSGNGRFSLVTLKTAKGSADTCETLNGRRITERTDGITRWKLVTDDGRFSMVLEPDSTYGNLTVINRRGKKTDSAFLLDSVTVSEEE